MQFTEFYRKAVENYVMKDDDLKKNVVIIGVTIISMRLFIKLIIFCYEFFIIHMKSFCL